MAETAVTLVINELVRLLVHEAKLLRGVHKEFEFIKDELESINCFLEAAENGGDPQYGVRIWVKQVREVAYDIEYVIDEYVLHMAGYHHEKGFIGFLHKIGHLLKTLKPSHGIATKIKDIKISVSEIKERSIRYGFTSIEQGLTCSNATSVKWLDPRIGSLFIKDDEVVGIESSRDELISWLVRGACRRSIISMVGMGGIGKTTLTKKVYENESVKRHFDFHVWITISQSYNVHKILITMAKQIYQAKQIAIGEINMMDEITIISMVRESLQQKSYVVVFDDVWNIQFLEFIKHTLPQNDKGSRIIITTRSDHIGLFCKESPFDQIYKLQPLSEDKAWELFCKKAFQIEFQGCCPEELKKLSLDIVQKCEGLPLAIIAIGGLLLTKKKVPLEWQKFLDNLSFELENNPHLGSVKKILALSYYDLPYYLKPCLLYFGILPKDYSITDLRLFYLWIAEGFIKVNKGKQLEEVAEDYLMELVQRNLVQVSFGEFDYQFHRKYRIHDLLHEIIRSKAEEQNFCRVLKVNDSSFNGKVRCLSILDARENVLETIEYSRLRSTIFIVNEISRTFIVKLFKKFKLLKVLDFENAPIDYLPEEMGSLFHLKHLNLRRTKVKILPNSMGRLKNLQFLNLMETNIRELPTVIFRLHKLRQLLCYNHDFEIESRLGAVQGVKVCGRIGYLKDLQSLSLIDVNHKSINIFIELRKLSQLRILGVSNLRVENGKLLCLSIESMAQLKELVASSINEDEVLDLHYISSPPQYLEFIFLKGRLGKFPNWIPKLHNLVNLSLYFSLLVEDPLLYVQNSPNLAFLNLHQAYDGEQLHIQVGGFQKLKKLILQRLKRLKIVEIDRGSLPILEDLEIGSCPQMKKVPYGIQHLENLKILDICEMQKEFVRNMQPNGGNDYWKVKNITFVRFRYRIKGERYQTYKLGDTELLDRLKG